VAIFGGVTPALGASDARPSVERPRPQEALEQLALASLLHRRLDVAEQPGGDQGVSLP
jgi:hypothetical protein